MTDRTGLRADDIVIRMTGCPNGCARPYLAEIGLVGRTPGKYNLYLGAAFDGSRQRRRLRRALRRFPDPQGCGANRFRPRPPCRPERGPGGLAFAVDRAGQRFATIRR